MTTKEASIIANVPERTIQHWCKNGFLSAEYVGGWQINLCDLTRFLSNRPRVGRKQSDKTLSLKRLLEAIQCTITTPEISSLADKVSAEYGLNRKAQGST